MSRVSKNIFANVAGQVAVTLMSFFGTRYVFQGLGGDALGILIFTLTLSAVLRSVLELGVCSTVIREVAANRLDDMPYVADVIRTASFLYWLGFGLLAVCLWLAAPTIVHFWLRLGQLSPAVAIKIVRVLGVGAILALPRAMYASVFRGFERMELNNGVDFVVSALQQCGTIGLVAFGASLIAVAYWVAACFFLSIVFYLALLVRIIPAPALIPFWRPAVLNRNWGFAGSMMWVSLLAMTHMESDKVLVSKFLPVTATGYYGFASSLTNRGAFLTNSIAQAAFPSITHVLNKSGHEAALREYRKLHDLICFGTVPLFASIAYVCPWLFRLMFNAMIAKSLIQPTILLCIANYLNATLNMPYIMSLASGRPEISVRMSWMALLVTVPCSIGLIYEFGLWGAGFSWVFYQVFACIVMIPTVYEECLQLSALDWYRGVVRIAGLIACTYGLVGLFVALSATDSLGMLSAGYALATVGFLAGSYLMAGDELRGSLMGFGRSFRISRALVG